MAETTALLENDQNDQETDPNIIHHLDRTGTQNDYNAPPDTEGKEYEEEEKYDNQHIIDIEEKDAPQNDKKKRRNIGTKFMNAYWSSYSKEQNGYTKYDDETSKQIEALLKKAIDTKAKGPMEIHLNSGPFFGLSKNQDVYLCVIIVDFSDPDNPIIEQARQINMNSGYKISMKRHPELGYPLDKSIQDEIKHSEFTEQQIGDEIKCEGFIADCTAMQRIVHLLTYFNKNQRNISSLYTYISSLHNYKISAFMEDWYHSKSTHFKTENDYKWFQNKGIDCGNSNGCVHMHNHRSVNGLDVKETILMEFIDYIHIFIFHPSSSKQNRSSKHQFYALGTRFRYTDNCKILAHPLYVKPKYANIKEELVEYFRSIYLQDDKDHLLRLQLEIIPTFNVPQQILQKLIKQEYIDENEKCVDGLWVDDIESKSNDDIVEIIKLAQANCIAAVNVIKHLFTYLPNFTYFTNYIFVILMNIKFEQMKETQEISKSQFNESIQERCETYSSLQRTATEWVRDIEYSGAEISQDNSDIKSAEDMQKLMMEIFELDQQELKSHLEKKKKHIISQFTSETLKTMKKAVIDNQNSFLRVQCNERSQPYIKKAKMKLKMSSIKQMKAVWNEEIDNHDIKVNDCISQDHVSSLVSYTDNSGLCTSFRETYRPISTNETIAQRKKRHAPFANMGRLLYESYIFYASTNSKVKVLYQGMSIQLLFKSLYCSFNAPSSLTTDRVTATNFCTDRGIIMMCESGDYSEFIRTLDMTLFSCFDMEKEHLIYETTLHIKDIWNPKDGVWIGTKMHMVKALSLYESLVRVGIVHTNLLKKKTQKRLCKMLKVVMEGTTSTYTTSSYVNSLLESLTTQNDKIWLNEQQIHKLNHELKSLFCGHNDELHGEYVSYLKNQCGVSLEQRFHFVKILKIQEKSVNLINRNLKKYNKIRTEEDILCELKNGRKIMFRLGITRVEDQVVLRIELIKSDQPAKVQFVIGFEEFNYHRITYPSLMSIGYANTQYIALPVEKSIAFSTKTEFELDISIVIHNFQGFNVKVKNMHQAKLLYFVYNSGKTNGPYTANEILTLYVKRKFKGNNLYVMAANGEKEWSKIPLRWRDAKKDSADLDKIEKKYPDLYETVSQPILFGAVEHIVFPENIPKEENKASSLLILLIVRLLGKIIAWFIAIFLALHCLLTAPLGALIWSLTRSECFKYSGSLIFVAIVIGYLGIVITPGVIVHIILTKTDLYNEWQSWMVVYIIFGIISFLITNAYFILNYFQRYHETLSKVVLLIIGVDFGDFDVFEVFDKPEDDWKVSDFTVVGGILFIFPALASLLPAIICGFIANFVWDEKFQLKCSGDIINDDLCFESQHGCCDVISSHDYQSSYVFIGGLASNILATWAIIRIVGYLLVNAFSVLSLHARRTK
eukprot:495455_1